MKKLLILICGLFVQQAIAQVTPFEKSGEKETATYTQVIAHYKALAQQYPTAKLLTYGKTDFGAPLNLLVLSKNKNFDPQQLKKAGKNILLVNNGIHPGEPEGIDASMMLARDILKGNKLSDNLVICIIPLYNIGGSHNRSSTSRANQNGPVAYGFRGNSKNYDLNRDFIKSDSKNSQSFQEIFNTWKPDVFVDMHTSNGSDYQYTMTLIPTQKDKLTPILGKFLNEDFVPALYRDMEQRGYPLIPYINSMGATPDEGISGFIESPRYSTGYAALHNVFSFMPETHMLKSYDKRVDASYKLLESYVKFITTEGRKIKQLRAQAEDYVKNQTDFPLAWKLNTKEFNWITFKGFESKYKPSDISGEKRLYYDRNAPYTKEIKFYNTYEPVLSVKKPYAYIIPKAWTQVIQLLKLNNVKLEQLKTDAVLEVDSYYIEDFKSAARPYEGHYLHSDVVLKTVAQKWQYYAGDYVVYPNQASNRYIIETLEPQATDSFFNWNFFDSALSMKEHFSAYIFEDTAAELLKTNGTLRQLFENKKASDADFAKNGRAQLDFIYKNSDYYEKTHNRYPVARINKAVQLPTVSK